MLTIEGDCETYESKNVCAKNKNRKRKKLRLGRRFNNEGAELSRLKLNGPQLTNMTESSDYGRIANMNLYRSLSKEFEDMRVRLDSEIQSHSKHAQALTWGNTAIGVGGAICGLAVVFATSPIIRSIGSLGAAGACLTLTFYQPYHQARRHRQVTAEYETVRQDLLGWKQKIDRYFQNLSPTEHQVQHLLNQVEQLGVKESSLNSSYTYIPEFIKRWYNNNDK